MAMVYSKKKCKAKRNKNGMITSTGASNARPTVVQAAPVVDEAGGIDSSEGKAKSKSKAKSKGKTPKAKSAAGEKAAIVPSISTTCSVTISTLTSTCTASGSKATAAPVPTPNTNKRKPIGMSVYKPDLFPDSSETLQGSVVFYPTCDDYQSEESMAEKITVKLETNKKLVVPYKAGKPMKAMKWLYPSDVSIRFYTPKNTWYARIRPSKSALGTYEATMCIGKPSTLGMWHFPWYTSEGLIKEEGAFIVATKETSPN